MARRTSGHDFGKGPRLIEIAQAEVGDAEGVLSFADGMQERQVKVRDGAMALVSIPGITQVAVAEFEPPSEVADKNERPFVTDWMVALGGVGQVYDQGVVQHGTVPFGHGFQSADELGQLFQALAADMGCLLYTSPSPRD